MAWEFGLDDAISIGGGIADFFSSRESDKAQQQRAAADRAAADQRTAQLLSSQVRQFQKILTSLRLTLKDSLDNVVVKSLHLHAS